MAPVEIRYDIPVKQAIEAVIFQLLGPSGRAATREKALAVTKLQEAVMWLEADAKLLADPIPAITHHSGAA
jgi:hypothetical protein